MKIEQRIATSVVRAVKELYGADIAEKDVQLQKTKKEFEGHLTLVVFPFVRISRKSPEDTGRQIGECLMSAEPAISGYNVIKGFLNLTVSAGCWIDVLEDIDAQEKYGIKKPGKDAPLVMVEYSSPNTNKPLHLGHMRNILLGWAVSNIMEANGNRVVRTNIVNDRGIHICKSMLAWQKYGNGETPASSGKKGDHLVGDYYVAFDKAYKAEIKKLVAEGMDEDGELHTIEIDDELEDFIRAHFEGSPYAGRIHLHIGDAMKIIPSLGMTFDLVFIDANKRHYLDYYKEVLDYVVPGGFIIADNTLWDGKVVDWGKKLDAQTEGILLFNDFVAADDRVEKVILPIRDGLTIIRKKD